MKTLINNKKIIIIGLGQQGKKIINFLILEGFINNIIGICKTSKTKNLIENQFRIKVYLDYKIILNRYKNDISFVFLGVKPEDIQSKIYYYLYNNYPDLKILIEKSFTSNNKILEELYKLNPKHSIVRNELHSLGFFEEIKKLDKNFLENINEIIILSNVNKKIFSSIISRNVFLLSYIFDYINFLNFQTIKLKSIKKINKIKYEIILIGNLNCIIKIILSEFEKETTNTTVLYKFEDNNKYIFNNNSINSIVANKKISNFKGKHKNYFYIFLESKINNLLLGKTNIREEIDGINYFRKLNTVDKDIKFN